MMVVHKLCGRHVVDGVAVQWIPVPRGGVMC